MKQVTRLNLIGLTVSTLAVAASLTMLSACGQNNTKLPQVGTPQSAAVIPPNLNGPLADPGSFPQAQVSAILGTYTGTAQVTNFETNEEHTQLYTITVSQAQNQGRNVFSVTYSTQAPTIQRLQGVMQAHVSSASVGWGGQSSLYILTSTPQNEASIYPYNPVMLQLQLHLRSDNSFDPASSSIYIVEGGFYSDVVFFNDDIVKR